MTEQINDGRDIIVEEKSENMDENVNAEKMDASTESSVVKKGHVSNLKKASKALHVAKSTMEQKYRKVKSGINAPAAQMKRKISTENVRISPGMSSGKGSNKTEKGIQVRQKQPSSRISSSTCSAPQNMKSEDSDKTKVKARVESRSSFSSDKGDKTKGVLVPPSTSHQQGQIDGHKYTNRVKRVANTMKLGTKMSGAVFSFKSDERAEKRKEYYMKLEEKRRNRKRHKLK